MNTSLITVTNLTGIILLFFVAACGSEAPKPDKIISSMHKKVLELDAPSATKQPFELKQDGQTRIDNYYWLRERENPKVISYLENENSYRDSVMEHLVAVQDEIFEEIKGRIKEQDASVPQLDNGYWYYYRYDEGHEYPIYCRKKETLDAPEEIMLNVNSVAEIYDYYNTSGLEVSPDNNLLAFGEDTLSWRIYIIRFKDLKTGKLLPDRIPGTNGSIAWANDN